MELIVDANILFSALIKDGFTAKLFFNERLRLYTSEFIFEEFSKYEELILKKTKRTPEEFTEIMTILREKITVIPEEDYASFVKKSEEISPDEKDVAYIALAMKLKCALWSNDKALKEQDFIKVYSSSEVKELV